MFCPGRYVPGTWLLCRDAHHVRNRCSLHLVDDIACILEELDVPDAPSIVSELKLHMAETVVSEDADTFFHRVRKDYTHLYTNPQFSASTLFQSRFLGYEEGATWLENSHCENVQKL